MPRLLPVLFLAAVAPVAVSATAFGQPSRGFEATAAATATAEELSTQSDLWAMEVEFKPMRLITVEVTDPATGEKREEQVWYLVYRATNRPLQTPPREEDRDPVNVLDPPPGPSMFVPEFTLLGQDPNRQAIYPDVVIPEAQAAIIRREVRAAAAADALKNVVEVVQPVPTPVAAGARGAQPVYGVAMWRGVDPRTANFRVYASGFSNGFKRTTGPDGKPLILRRSLVLDFWRPGDEFDVTEPQFRFRGEPRWVYLPDEVEPAATPADA